MYLYIFLYIIIFIPLAFKEQKYCVVLWQCKPVRWCRVSSTTIVTSLPFDYPSSIRIELILLLFWCLCSSRMISFWIFFPSFLFTFYYFLFLCFVFLLMLLFNRKRGIFIQDLYIFVLLLLLLLLNGQKCHDDIMGDWIYALCIRPVSQKKQIFRILTCLFLTGLIYFLYITMIEVHCLRLKTSTVFQLSVCRGFLNL